MEENNNYLLGPVMDFLIFVGPVLIALFTALLWNLTGQEGIPLWGFLLFIIAFDVAHVWATLYRVYLDPLEMDRRTWFYLLPIPIIFFLAFGLHLYSPVIYWTIIAYIAVIHFVRQPYGFVAIYKVKHAEVNPLDWKLDRWAVWMAAIGPLLLWHASPERGFDWFGHGEQFLFKLPPESQPFILSIYISFLVFYVLRQCYLYQLNKTFNRGKIMVMLGTWVTWSVGIYTTDPLVSAAFINLFHGIPFFGITWLYCNNKWGVHSLKITGFRAFFMRFISRKSHLFFFFLICFVPALLEEGLWESLVWHSRSMPIFDSENWGTLQISFAVALLSLPQVVHYFLDAYIWRMRSGENPDLKEYLELV